MNVEIVEILAATFSVWIIVAVYMSARAKRRRDAEAESNRRFDGIWH